MHRSRSVTIHVTMPASLVYRLDTLAKTYYVSRSEYIRYCVMLNMRHNKQAVDQATNIGYPRAGLGDINFDHPPNYGHTYGLDTGDGKNIL